MRDLIALYQAESKVVLQNRSPAAALARQRRGTASRNLRMGLLDLDLLWSVVREQESALDRSD